MTILKKRACVIGAGPAGIASLRHLASLGDRWDVVAYERGSSVGGQWVYQDVVDGHVQSSMYKNLRTNLPKELMNYPDYPFPDGRSSFLHHSDVLKYVTNYAERHHLVKLIQFQHEVVKVFQLSPGNSGSWTVTVRNFSTGVISMTHFDVVFVCNGHFNETFSPQIKGIETFAGEIIHSQVYRDPVDFIGKRIACIGAQASGLDISLELAGYAEKVYLCHGKEKIQSPLPENLTEKPVPAELKKIAIAFADGDAVEIDALIFCTGYSFAYPFFDCRNLKLNYSRKGVENLYQHLVFIDNPRLFFIGLPMNVTPLPLCHTQAEFCVQVTKGAAKLPSGDQMRSWLKAYLESRRADPQLRGKAIHFLDMAQYPYMRELARLGGFKCRVTPAYEKLNREIAEARKLFIATYKDFNYRFIDANEYERID